MTSQIFYRAALDIEETDGRTLTGKAFYFDMPSRVRDPGTSPYMEEFARTSVTKTLQERAGGIFPLFVSHDYSRDPVGAVRFTPGKDGLDFEARISKTIDGDEKLELINDGAMRSVSVGFRAVKNGSRRGPDGPITVRSEIALRELSLAPTGFAQHQGAEILAVRAVIETPRLDALRKRRIRL